MVGDGIIPPVINAAQIQKLAMIDLRQLRYHLVWVYEGEVLPQNRKMTTFIPEQTAFFIRKGSVMIGNDHGETRAEAGQWIFPREGRRCHEFAPGSAILSVHFNLAWPGGQQLYQWDNAVVIDGDKAPKLYTSAKRLERLVERRFPDAKTALKNAEGDVEAHLLIQSYFAAWLHYYVKTLHEFGLIPARLGRIDPRALQVLQTLERHPFTETFREAELARQLGLSVSQLDRLFVKDFGVTPHHYLERRKLEQAVDRLEVSLDPVKQIAYDLGFSSLSHFSSWLRRKTNLSPRELRAKRALHRAS